MGTVTPELDRLAGSGDTRRLRRLRGYGAASLLGAAVGTAVLLAFATGSAEAAVSVTCSDTSNVLTVALSGTPASDTLAITTSGGDFAVSLDGSPVCGGQTFAVSTDPTVAVQESTTSPVSTTFSPGTSSGLTFVGAAGVFNFLDLSALTGGVTVHAGGSAGSTSPTTVSWSNTSDTFENVAGVIGSAAGNTAFVASTGAGWTFEGQGSGNTLDLSALPAGVIANEAAGVVQVGSSVLDSFTGISTVVGSAAGGTTFVPSSASNETFADVGVGATDTIDFSQVSTSPSVPLRVNVSGAPAGPLANDTASVGTVTYTFTTGGSRFKTFVGAPTGNTYFIAGSAAGYSFLGGPSVVTDTLDLSASSQGPTVNVASGVVSIAAATDTFTGISTFIGAAVGGNTFVAGNGNESFVDPSSFGPPATLDFSLLTSPLVVNLTGTTAHSTSPHTATAAGNVYSFASGYQRFTSIRGAAVGSTIVYADSTPAYSFTGLGGSNVLDMSAASNGVTVNLVNGTITTASGSDIVSGFTTFVGSTAGNNSFRAAPGVGATFTGIGAGNVLDLGALPAGPVVDMTTGVVQPTTGPADHFSGISVVVGSSAGATTFKPGASNETFADTGGGGAGDILDFTNVATSNGTPLVVNVSGGPFGPTTNNTATVGATTYSFTTGGSRFTTFVGASSGHTDFVAGAGGGYNFTGQASGNTLDLSAAPQGPTINLATGVAQIGATSDTITGITSVVGSAAGGTTYVAGPASGATFSDPAGAGPRSTLDLTDLPTDGSTPLKVNFTGNIAGGADGDSAVFGANVYNFATGASRFTTVHGATNGNTTIYVGATTGMTFDGTGSGNALDFSAIGSPLTIDVTSGQAQTAAVTDTFSGFQQLVGSSSGNTHFVAGSQGGFRFLGQGAGNLLDFTPAADSAVIDVTAVPATAQLGASATDVFNGITGFVGPPVGGSTFDAGSVAGFSFTGQGTGNIANFSADTHALAAQLSADAMKVAPNALTPNSVDTLADVNTVVGTSGDDSFAQTVTGNFDLSGGGGADTLDLTSAGPSTVTENPGTVGCTGNTLDATATGTNRTDNFHCVAHVLFDGPPPNPIATTATAVQGGGVTVGWLDPADNGGSAITGYDAYCSTSPTPTATGTPSGTITGATATSMTVGGLTSGARYNCVVTAINSNGQSPASAPVGATTDGIAPTVSTRAPAAPFQLGPHATTTYSATDANGIASYDVGYRFARWNGPFGAWTYPTAWQRTTRTAQTVSLAPGQEVCFEVRARDPLGNTSHWSTPRCTTRPVDDRGMSAVTTGWTRAKDRAAYLATATTTTRYHAALRLSSARFDRLALLVTRCGTCGRIGIYLNGTLWRTVSTHATRIQHQVLLVLPSVSARTATITLKDMTSGARVTVDGLGVFR